jgi:hypothetical protein
MFFHCCPMSRTGIVGVADPPGPGSLVTATASMAVTPAGSALVSDAEPSAATVKVPAPIGVLPVMIHSW